MRTPGKTLMLSGVAILVASTVLCSVPAYIWPESAAVLNVLYLVALAIGVATLLVGVVLRVTQKKEQQAPERSRS